MARAEAALHETGKPNAWVILSPPWVQSYTRTRNLNALYVLAFDRRAEVVTLDDVSPLTGVWHRPDMSRALAEGDWPTVLRAVTDTGWSQTEIAGCVGISQAQISRLLRGTNRDPGLGTIRALCDGLGIPRRLAGLADSTPVHPGKEDPTKRRDFLTGTLGLAGTSALAGQVDDEEHVRITSLAYRQLEQHTPTRAMVGPVTAHLSLARRLADDTVDGQRSRMLAAVSEAAGLAAWLHADLAEPGQARRFYRMSIAAASQSGNPLLALYQQASLGQYAAASGDPAAGLRLIRNAATRLPRSAPTTARAWVAALEGVALAHLGDRSALATLDTAERHAEAAVHDEPVWPWVFKFDAVKIANHRVAAAARLGIPKLAEAAMATTTGQVRSPKQAALAAVDHARMLAAEGEYIEAARYATTAYDTARQYGSERVRVAVRDFRAGITARHAAMADLDERLAAGYMEDDA